LIALATGFASASVPLSGGKPIVRIHGDPLATPTLTPYTQHYEHYYYPSPSQNMGMQHTPPLAEPVWQQPNAHNGPTGWQGAELTPHQGQLAEPSLANALGNVRASIERTPNAVGTTQIHHSYGPATQGIGVQVVPPLDAAPVGWDGLPATPSQTAMPAPNTVELDATTVGKTGWYDGYTAKPPGANCVDWASMPSWGTGMQSLPMNQPSCSTIPAMEYKRYSAVHNDIIPWTKSSCGATFDLTARFNCYGHRCCDI